MSRRKSVSAEELMRQLEADPKWTAQRDAKLARRAERQKRIDSDQASMIADLAAVGVCVRSVYDFVGKQAAPETALPVLVRHLNEKHLAVVREGIIRALGLPCAREIAFDSLRHAYCTERDPSLRWVIANALSGMAHLEELAELPGIEEFAALFK